MGIARGGALAAGGSDADASERRLFGFGIARMNDHGPDWPTCIIDVDAAMLRLSQTALGVRMAANACNNTATEAGAFMCASAIANIIQFIGFGAEFLEGAAQECGSSIAWGDLCAEDMTELFSGLAQVVQAATGIKAVCGGFSSTMPDSTTNSTNSLNLNSTNLTNSTNSTNSANSTPILPVIMPGVGVAAQLQQRSVIIQPEQPQQLLQPLPFDNIFNTFGCVFDAMEAADFLARASDVIASATADCSIVNDMGPEGREACELDIVGIIESFSFEANSIAGAITRCPIIANLQAQCAANIIQVAASVGALTNSFGGANLCDKSTEAHFVYHETHLLPPPQLPPPGEVWADPNAIAEPNPGEYYGPEP